MRVLAEAHRRRRRCLIAPPLLVGLVVLILGAAATEAAEEVEQRDTASEGRPAQPSGPEGVAGGSSSRPLVGVTATAGAEAPEPRVKTSEAPFEAFFWECPPVSRATAARRPFEFVLIEAPRVARIRADAEPFAAYIKNFTGQPVVRAFPNLRGDSDLVAPAMMGDDPDAYSHVAMFFRRAPDAQQDAQWQMLGEAVHKRLQEQNPDRNIWVSTEGSGVHWLHMRLDPQPKYYHHMPYREPNFDLPPDELQIIGQAGAPAPEPTGEKGRFRAEGVEMHHEGSSDWQVLVDTEQTCQDAQQSQDVRPPSEP